MAPIVSTVDTLYISLQTSPPDITTVGCSFKLGLTNLLLIMFQAMCSRQHSQSVDLFVLWVILVIHMVVDMVIGGQCSLSFEVPCLDGRGCVLDIQVHASMIILGTILKF